MTNVKQEVRKLLDRMPDDCTIDDLQYQLYVLDKIRHAEQEIAEGKGVPHEEVKQRLSKWLPK
jgi:predicted transcriptional regulator